MGKNLKGEEIGKGFTQRKDGRYQSRIYHEGREIVLYGYDLDKLRRETYKKENYIKEGFEIGADNMTLDDWVQECFELYSIHKKDTSLLADECNYRRIQPYLGFFKLKSLRMSHIQKAINQLYDNGYAYSTIVSSKNFIYSRMQLAIQNRIIKRNPCIGVILPVNDTDEVQPLTKQEQQKFFEAVYGQRYYNLFRLLLETGMRVGEACALQWRDIDFDKRLIHVTKTLNRTKQYNRRNEKINDKRYRIHITTPKKDASNRFIPMSDNAIIALKSWKTIQDKDKANQGIAWGRKNYLLQDYPDLVFTTSYGNPLPPSDAWKYCSQGVNRINEEEVITAVVQNREPQLLTLHPHVFRHTFATECMDQGMNPKVLIKILGHSNMQMLNRYTHANTERIVEEFNRCRVKTV